MDCVNLVNRALLYIPFAQVLSSTPVPPPIGKAPVTSDSIKLTSRFLQLGVCDHTLRQFQL